jgi:hypothetical protein
MFTRIFDHFLGFLRQQILDFLLYFGVGRVQILRFQVDIVVKKWADLGVRNVAQLEPTTLAHA